MRSHAQTRVVLLTVGCSVLFLCSSYILQSEQAIRLPRKIQTAAAPRRKPTLSLARIPLSFEANQGQTDATVRFVSRGRGYGLFLTGKEAVLEVQRTTVRLQNSGAGSSRFNGINPLPGAAVSVLRLKLLDANANPAVTGLDELPGKANYFTGKDPTKWRANVPTYARVRYRDVYPGVDLVYYGNQGGELESDFVVSPGADASAITMEIAADRTLGHMAAAAMHPRIATDGDLLIPTENGEIRFHKPVTYQTRISSGQRIVVDGCFQLDARNRVHFALGPYDRTQPLVIDPVLSYSTYLGGADGANYGFAIAVDSLGNAYITGETLSAAFPTVSPLPAPYDGLQATTSAFVTKLNFTGTGIDYSTYLGGNASGASSTYYGHAIAVDSSGDAYVTGVAAGPSNFPTTTGAYQTDCLVNSGGSCLAAFLAKLSPEGSSLIYSTYIGGNGGTLGDKPYSIAVDASGDAYVTGSTTSSDFPTTLGAYQPTQPFNSAFCSLPAGASTCLSTANSCSNAFAVEINAQGSNAVYSTYLGGSCSQDQGNSIAVDSSGYAYIAGSTTPAGDIISGSGKAFPTTSGAFQTAPTGTGCGGSLPCENAFITKLNSSGSSLMYSTLLGGSANQAATGIAIDGFGNAYVTGYTASSDFPTANPIQASLAGAQNAFVTKLNAAGSGEVYSTYLGGSGTDQAQGIAVDSTGNAYVTGFTGSTNFPTASATQPSYNSYATSNAFVSKLNSSGSALIYSSFLGGSISDDALAIALDQDRNVYVTGFTNSIDFPVTSGAFQTQAPAKTCTNFPTGYIPFTQIIATVFGSFSSGISSGYLEVGYLSSQGASGLSNIPLPNSVSGQGFCYLAELTPGVRIDAWIPTAAMRVGNFSSFSGHIINPATGSAYPGNVLPTPSSGSVFAWPVGAPVTPSPSGFVTQISGLALPVTSASTSALNFGGQGVGNSSTAQTVTVNNRGDAALTISGITVSGYFAQTNNCPSSLSAMSNCSIAVTFAPLGPGVFTGSLSIWDSASGSPHAISLTGTAVVFTAGPNPPRALPPPSVPEPGQPGSSGVDSSPIGIGPRRPVHSTLAPISTPPASISISAAPGARFSSSLLTFPAQSVGTSSIAQTVTLNNFSNSPLAISTITASEDFTQTNDCGNSLDAGAHCTISVRFKPETAGKTTGFLSIADKSSGSPNVVVLNGTGVRP